jgi:mRNA-degrading endonuclease RelE of RelBE toxin-antitoxin system
MAMRPLTPEQRRRLRELARRARREWDKLTPEQRRKLVEALRTAGFAAGEIVRRRRARGGLPRRGRRR